MVSRKALGCGSYGSVFQAKRRSDGHIVAVKKTKNDGGIPYTTIREVAALRSLGHPHIIPLLDVFYTRDSTCMVFPMCPGTLRKRIDENGIPSCTIRRFSTQLLDGLQYLHAKGIIHRDLTPSNVLITSDDNLVIADFGLCRYTSPWTANTAQMVTLWYRAPEMLLGMEDYGPPVDMWSFGCVLAEMVNGCPLFAGDDVNQQLALVLEKIRWQPEAAKAAVKYLGMRKNDAKISSFRSTLKGDDACNALIMECLLFDPDRRISALEALKAPFIGAMEID